MKKIYLIMTIPAALALSGCVPRTGLGAVGDLVCKHQAAERVALNLAMLRAEQITDSVRREAAMSAVRISLAVLDSCPEPI